MAHRTCARLALVCAASIAVLALATSTMAVAAPEPGVTNGPATDDIPAVMLAQADQSAAADVIDGSFAGRSGWAGGRFEDDHQTITLFWAGDVPYDLSALVSQPIHDVTVKIQKVPYSFEDFNAEMASIGSQALAQGLKPTAIATMGPSNDRTYLDIAVVPDTDAKVIDSMTHRLPYKIRQVGGVVLAVGGRQVDQSPFWAGATIHNVEEPQTCSTGFAARRNDNGEVEIITAKHCASDGNAAGDHFDTPPPHRLGQAGSGSSVADAVAIRNKAYAGESYTGDWQSDHGVLIGGHRGPYDFEYVCASGALSGGSCDGYVHETHACIHDCTIKYGYWATNVHDDSRAFEGEGDSGGPSFVHRTDDGKLGIRGMIDAGRIGTEASCRGYTSGRTCWHDMFFVGQANLLDRLNITWVGG